jgi:hypothetical protein
MECDNLSSSLEEGLSEMGDLKKCCDLPELLIHLFVICLSLLTLFNFSHLPNRIMKLLCQLLK